MKHIMKRKKSKQTEQSTNELWDNIKWNKLNTKLEYCKKEEKEIRYKGHEI